MIKEINPTDVIVDRRFQFMCLRPYYKHPNGCPNYGKKTGCPPRLPLINEILDFNNPLYVIFTKHNIGTQANKMRITHPNWTDRQIYNPRYWQGAARKEHKIELERFALEYPELIINHFPEAHGINCTELMKSVGVNLNWRWPPKHKLNNISYIISVGGTTL